MPGANGGGQNKHRILMEFQPCCLTFAADFTVCGFAEQPYRTHTSAMQRKPNSSKKAGFKKMAAQIRNLKS
jgi:hypothetical protein